MISDQSTSANQATVLGHTSLVPVADVFWQNSMGGRITVASWKRQELEILILSRGTDCSSVTMVCRGIAGEVYSLKIAKVSRWILSVRAEYCLRKGEASGVANGDPDFLTLVRIKCIIQITQRDCMFVC